jgi:hypothetical protein
VRERRTVAVVAVRERNTSAAGRERGKGRRVRNVSVRDTTEEQNISERRE